DPLLGDSGQPPTEPAPTSGSGFLDQALAELPENSAFPQGYSPLAYPDTRRDLLERLYREGATAHLYRYLRVFGEATLVEFLHARWGHLHRPEERTTLDRLVRLLVAIGLWDSPDEGKQFVQRLPELAYLLVERSLFSVMPVPLAASRGLLFRIPCPL